MRFITDKNRSILREMVSTDFKVRYQGSVLGYLWSLLRPLFIFLILYVVFTQVFKVGQDIKFYPVYLLLGIVLWNFFSESTNFGLSSIVDRGDLIRKISIPRYLVVLSTNAAALINLGLNLIIVVSLALIVGVSIELSWLLVPLLIIELWILSLALSFILSAFFIKYRDAKYIWEVIMQAAFYATPILYPLSYISNIKFQQLIMLNPVAQILQDARWAFVSKQAITGWSILPGLAIFIPFSIVILLSIFAYYYFRREAKYFAENL